MAKNAPGTYTGKPNQSQKVYGTKNPSGSASTGPANKTRVPAPSKGHEGSVPGRSLIAK